MPTPENSFSDLTHLSPKEQLYALNERINQQMQEGISRGFDPSDIAYLFDRAPFLQIVNGDASTYQETTFEVITMPSGWEVHHYGDALASSPGRLLFGGTFVSTNDDDEGGGGAVNSGHGTLINQAVDTAKAMIDLVVQNGWGSILIVDGHPLMQWAAWAHAKSYNNLLIEGFEPTPADEERRDRVLEQTVEGLRSYSRIERMLQRGNRP